MFNVLQRIQELRVSRGWSVYALAKRSGIPQSTFATWYAKNLYPPVDKIEMICNALGITLQEFFSASDQGAGSKEFSEKLLLLTEEQKEAVLRIVDMLISK